MNSREENNQNEQRILDRKRLLRVLCIVFGWLCFITQNTPKYDVV